MMTDTSLHVERTLALIKPDVVHLAEEIEDVILRSGFTILQLCKQKPLDPCIWLSHWLMRNNPNQPKIEDAAIVQEAE
uniref:Nucleoside diphosphate kinase B n=1 Tax=Gadus morhua TaxID=8049 RepID=A0A8C5C5W5_GADMO